MIIMIVQQELVQFAIHQPPRQRVLLCGVGLRQLSPVAMQALLAPGTRELYLCRNKLCQLPGVSGNGDLQLLDMAVNRLCEFPKEFAEITSLKVPSLP